MITPDAARAFLLRDFDQYLPLLGALEFEPVRAIRGVAQDGTFAALALVIEPEPVPASMPTVMVTAASVAALAQLLAQGGWPEPATWATQQAELVPQLEQLLGAQHDPTGGLQFYIANVVPQRPHPLARRLTLQDADMLDLAPCSLGPIALRHWIKRGWHVYGAVDGATLLCHAVAAYPLGDTEEISAVFTAPDARQQGLAGAVVAATVADIVGRGLRALYTCRKTNRASRSVAEGLGFVPLLETWEIVTIDA